MTSGVINFYVDSVQCPTSTTTDGKGGVFNCGDGLVGTVFRLECTTPCDPILSVVELRLYKHRAITLYGTPYEYPDNNQCAGVPLYDVDRLFNTGSLMYISTTGEAFCRYTSESTRLGVGFEFTQISAVSKLIVSGLYLDDIRVSINTSDVRFNDEHTAVTKIDDIGLNLGYKEEDACWKARQMAIWRRSGRDWLYM